MKHLTLIAVLYLHFGQLFAQSVDWQREIDYSPLVAGSSSVDQLLNLHLVDTNTFYSTVYTGRMRVPNFSDLYPLMLKHRASDGAIIDTIRFFDTTSTTLSCFNRQTKDFWFYMIKSGRVSGSVFQKVNLQGRTTFYRSDRFFPIDSVTAFPSRLIPANDGGYYLLGYQNRTFNNQRLRLWQVSRWDSLATRKWVKEYMFEYTEGVPQEAEFLPNGNLFVSGWHGPQLMALEIDTANGRMVDRKVLYTHPRNLTWGSGSIYRHPLGYFISARENVQADTSSFNGFFNLQGRPL